MQYIKKVLLLFAFIFISTNIFSQDIDFYHKYKNDNYKMPSISSKMSYEEFELLSENTRMMDMVYAMIVPGYIHFKSYDKTTGYALLGTRSLAFGVMGYEYYKEGGLKDTRYDLIEESADEALVFNVALGVAIATYLYDWIHGDYLLRKKQENIRYKYSPRVTMAYSSCNLEQYYPAVSLNISL